MTRKRHSLDARPRRGFTLIEIISATGMFSILVGAVYLSFTSAMRMREQAEERLEGRATTEYVIGVIKRDLEGVMPPVGLLAGEFVGERSDEGEDRDDTLLFHSASAAVRENDPWGDIQKIEYSLEDPEPAENAPGVIEPVEEQGFDFVRATTRNLLASIEEDPEEQRLLSNVRSLEFNYYFEDEWTDEWDSKEEDNELPEGVSVRIEFYEAEGKPRRLPIELVIPLVIERRPAAEGDESEGGAQGGA